MTLSAYLPQTDYSTEDYRGIKGRFLAFARRLPLGLRFILLQIAPFSHRTELWLNTVQSLAAKYPLGLFERLNIKTRMKMFQRKPWSDLDSEAINAPAAVVAARDKSFPNVDFKHLSAQVLEDAMRDHGALVVRNALSKDEAAMFRSQIKSARKASLQAREAARLDGDMNKANGRYYVPLSVKSNKLNPKMAFGLEAANTMLADSPPVFCKFIKLISDSGLKALIENYLKGSVALSIEKSVLRRAVPDDTDRWDCAWHQDGAFLGSDIFSLNMWVALSDCGVDSPSLDLITKRYRETLPTGTDRAPFTWSLGPDLISAEIAEHGYEHLEINEGDLVFFDHFNVHRTGMLKGMTKPRYAIESWFFSEYGFPDSKSGLKL